MNFSTRYLIEYNIYIYLDNIHAKNLKFGIDLPFMMFHKFDVAILKILYFENFICMQDTFARARTRPKSH